MLLLSNPLSGNYEIIDKYTAKMQLLGHEVKSLKAKRGSIKGAFVRVLLDGAWIEKMTIPPYQVGNTSAAYDTMRSRKVLMTKAELRKLSAKTAEKGLTALPIELYNNAGRIEVIIALVKHLNKHDKREVIKAKEAKLEIARTLKNIR